MNYSSVFSSNLSSNVHSSCRLPLLVPLRKRCADIHRWTTWLRRHALCCRTHPKSTRCWVISTALTLQTYRSEQFRVLFSVMPLLYHAMCKSLVWFFLLVYRSRHPGCASVRRVWSSIWSRTSRPPCSSKALWSNGQPGWTTWSPRCSSLTSTGPASPGQLGSSCWSGPSTGLKRAHSVSWWIYTMRQMSCHCFCL